MEKLTEKEIKIISLLGDAWREYINLEEFHPDDISDFRYHIHRLQDLISQRLAVRIHPELFNKNK
jgi:hypothetical protein